MDKHEARVELAEAIADIKQTAPSVDIWHEIGTPDLPGAVQELVLAPAPGTQHERARRVSQAFIVHPGQLYSMGIDNLAFGTAILSLRLALAHLGEE
ncbi:hypothetical protein PGH47_43005 (plasmid) [Streptomyces sp. HUAS 31]|uniref:hypothetical protein n=1 Tax=Streptomyces TaxID=1883 RepID=UPI002306DAC0|nr:hypothetical protein [Streptomyces sp. HUAS 31]WCE02517.1 hypothetical protein PGH47_43005 [Streptomyces sp. HUAS 31]